MNRIPFVKATAYGNDFLIVGKEHQGADAAALTRAMCERNHGIGADGVEWLSEVTASGARIELINADGSFAELSGNGTRCVAAYLTSQGHHGDLAIATDAGPRLCRPVSSDGRSYRFLTGMGQPEVGAPFVVDVALGSYRGVPVSMGNPHFVIFVAEFPGSWQDISRRIQARMDVFPQGINVEWVKVTSPDEIAIRIYERGAGETQSSGTGSSASAAASIAFAGCSETLTVHAPGGSQRVEWHPGTPLMLEGEAHVICVGEYYL
ncbi:MAG: diaminopimelate epimerase [Terracidiphilus sp.]|nr:diaminopimelate epimerase [Terracidiphilus sp.]